MSLVARSRKLSDSLSRRLPFGQRRLDYLVVAHPREAEIRALPVVIEHFPPRNVLWAGDKGDSRSVTSLLEAWSQAGVPVTDTVQGMALDLGGGAQLLADHGYAPVNPPEWTPNQRPQVALLIVAAGDRDGLPSPETLAALEGYTLLRTDKNGWIHLSTDGERMWVEVEKRRLMFFGGWTE